MARRPRSASDAIRHALTSFLASMPLPAKKVIVGVSGGPDSSVLLHALSTHPQRDFELCAAHVNHRLRGAESEADEAWARAFCDQFGVSLEVVDGTLGDDRVRSRGVEAAARELRYER